METIDLARVPLSAGDRVLDLGCGQGRHAIAAWWRHPVHCVGVDLSEADVTAAHRSSGEFRAGSADDGSRSLAFGVADGLGLPFPDACFDVVICSEVLEHIGPYESVLEEIRRVLRPGGILAASVPRAWPERICWWLSDAYHANEGGHIRIFSTRALEQDIAALGFRRYARHGAHALHSPYWWLQCLLWERRDRSFLVKLYHRLLVWDLVKRPWLTRALEALLNPVLGKSVVMYFRKAPA